MEKLGKFRFLKNSGGNQVNWIKKSIGLATLVWILNTSQITRFFEIDFLISYIDRNDSHISLILKVSLLIWRNKSNLILFPNRVIFFMKLNFKELFEGAWTTCLSNATYERLSDEDWGSNYLALWMYVTCYLHHSIWIPNTQITSWFFLKFWF